MLTYIGAIVCASVGIALAIAAGADPGPSWQAFPAGALIGVALVLAFIAGHQEGRR